MTLFFALTLLFSNSQLFQMMMIRFWMSQMHLRTGRPHLGQLLTLKQTLSPSPLHQRLAAAEQLHMFDLLPLQI